MCKITHCVKLHSVKLRTVCKITHCVYNYTLCTKFHRGPFHVWYGKNSPHFNIFTLTPWVAWVTNMRYAFSTPIYPTGYVWCNCCLFGVVFTENLDLTLLCNYETANCPFDYYFLWHCQNVILDLIACSMALAIPTVGTVNYKVDLGISVGDSSVELVFTSCTKYEACNCKRCRW